MAKSIKALLTGRIQMCKTNPSIAHIGLATHGRSIQIGSSQWMISIAGSRVPRAGPAASACVLVTIENTDYSARGGTSDPHVQVLCRRRPLA
jgi:hypothetical protein